jgi:dynein heavy chain
MNIDGYLRRVHDGLGRLEELISKLNDVLENRVDANLKVVSRTLLIDLPSDRSFSFEDFVATQSKYITAASADLIIRNKEVERATTELVQVSSCENSLCRFVSRSAGFRAGKSRKRL